MAAYTPARIGGMLEHADFHSLAEMHAARKFSPIQLRILKFAHEHGGGVEELHSHLMEHAPYKRSFNTFLKKNPEMVRDFLEAYPVEGLASDAKFARHQEASALDARTATRKAEMNVKRLKEAGKGKTVPVNVRQRLMEAEEELEGAQLINGLTSMPQSAEEIRRERKGDEPENVRLKTVIEVAPIVLERHLERLCRSTAIDPDRFEGGEVKLHDNLHEGAREFFDRVDIIKLLTGKKKTR